MNKSANIYYRNNYCDVERALARMQKNVCLLNRKQILLLKCSLRRRSAQKECAEAEYWLELLYESDYINKSEFESIYADCQELMRLIVATTKTLQNKNE